MKKKNDPIAILSADYHLSHNPPIWRSNESDWYDAMARPLHEINELQEKYKCPVLCAGDIFDKWNSPAELINFALKNLPDEIYAVPGQHDIPNHNIQEIARSAFASLTLTERINWTTHVGIKNLYVNSFPYGRVINPVQNYRKADLNVALVHDYVWMRGHSYPNAPKEKQIPRVIKKNNKNMIDRKYYGYDMVVYGDNHAGFTTTIGKTTIWNCGALMRRDKDQIDYKPRVGLLYSDGHVEPYYLDVSKDKHLTADEMKDAKEFEEIDMEKFAVELRKLGTSSLDFAEAMKRFWCTNNTRKAVQDIVSKAMEK